MRDQQQLAQMMHIGHKDIVSSLPLAVHPQLTPKVFTKMSTAVRPILLLLHLLHDQSTRNMLEWAKKGLPDSMTKDAEFADCAQATSGCSRDCNTATQADATSGGHLYSQDEAACSRTRSHLALLRSALLILKLASLTTGMDLEYAPALLAPNAIWRALSTIADNAGKLTDPADQDKAGAEDEQRLHLSVHLVKLTMPALRQLLSQEADESSFCCNLLLALMTNASSAVYGAVASELLRAGEQALSIDCTAYELHTLLIAKKQQALQGITLHSS